MSVVSLEPCHPERPADLRAAIICSWLTPTWAQLSSACCTVQTSVLDAGAPSAAGTHRGIGEHLHHLAFPQFRFLPPGFAQNQPVAFVQNHWLDATMKVQNRFGLGLVVHADILH